MLQFMSRGVGGRVDTVYLASSNIDFCPKQSYENQILAKITKKENRHKILKLGVRLSELNILLLSNTTTCSINYTILSADVTIFLYLPFHMRLYNGVHDKFQHHFVINIGYCITEDFITNIITL